MQLFQCKKGAVRPIEKDSFKLEKEIQELVESNLETLFGFEFVSSEFQIGEFRLDTLAYDAQNNAFIIIEYKKGHSYSVVDQGYSYLSVMLNNKADFILEYNEKTSKQIRRSDIDWASSRVLFVSPSFNSYQRNSVNFKDVPFELWEIRRFENGLIALEHQSSNSQESIDSISSKRANSVIQHVGKEVQGKTEEQLITVLSKDLKIVWQALKERLLDLPGTAVHTTQNYLSIKYDGTALLYVRFKKSELNFEIRRGNIYPDGKSRDKFFELDDPKQRSRIREWQWKSGIKGSVYVFSIQSLGEIDYLMYLVKQRYDFMT